MYIILALIGIAALTTGTGQIFQENLLGYIPCLLGGAVIGWIAAEAGR